MQNSRSFRRERGMGGELEFTNSWRAGIEVGVCRCKSCIIRVKVSSWVVKPRTHGHCVPLTLSLKAQNPNALTLPFSKLQLATQEMENHPEVIPSWQKLHSFYSSTNQLSIKNHTVRNLNFLSKNSTFISQIDRIRFLKKAKRFSKLTFHTTISHYLLCPN